VCSSLKAERDGVHVTQEEQVGSFLELQQQVAAAKAAMRAVVNQPRHILPFLQPGRLVNVAARASGMHTLSQTTFYSTDNLYKVYSFTPRVYQENHNCNIHNC